MHGRRPRTSDQVILTSLIVNIYSQHVGTHPTTLSHNTACPSTSIRLSI